jgi:hypothetical protein
MKTRICLLVLLLGSLGATSPTYGQGEKKPRTVADYSPRTLRELSALQPDKIATDPTYKDSKDIRIVVHGDLLPSRVKVLYDGSTRPLIENKRNVIKAWANKFAGAPEFYTANYQTEALFSEDGDNYWLVVRKQLLPSFEQELKKGEVVELFLIKLGNTRIGEKLEPVLLVEKFGKP